MNFVSTIVGQPYTRIQRIAIDYVATNTANVVVTHQLHVPLLDGTHQPLNEPVVAHFAITPEQMESVVALYMPGDDVATGTFVTTGGLLVGLYSIIRENLSAQ